MIKRRLLFATLMAWVLCSSLVQPAGPLHGAWRMQDGTTEHILVIQDHYLVHTSFDKTNKKFIQTHGGTIEIMPGRIQLTREFYTADSGKIGKSVELPYKLEDDVLHITHDGMEDKWSRVDHNEGALAGVWRITSRMRDGAMSPMNPGPRKTIKVLSGNRFQWIAINPEAKGFYGTGGGTYTFENGTYTEHIEFFSRDGNRVGASLAFEGSVSGDIWTHQGKSSNGEPLKEEWTRQH